MMRVGSRSRIRGPSKARGTHAVTRPSVCDNPPTQLVRDNPPAQVVRDNPPTQLSADGLTRVWSAVVRANACGQGQYLSSAGAFDEALARPRAHDPTRWSYMQNPSMQTFDPEHHLED